MHNGIIGSANHKRVINGTYRKDLTTSKSISPFRLSKYFFKSWSQCSKTNVNFLSLCNTSYNLTTFLCFNSFSRQISLSADDGTPCVQQTEKVVTINRVSNRKGICSDANATESRRRHKLTSSSSSNRTLFKATISWVSRFLALKTVP